MADGYSYRRERVRGCGCNNPLENGHMPECPQFRAPGEATREPHMVDPDHFQCDQCGRVTGMIEGHDTPTGLRLYLCGWCHPANMTPRTEAQPGALSVWIPESYEEALAEADREAEEKCGGCGSTAWSWRNRTNGTCDVCTGRLPSEVLSHPVRPHAGAPEVRDA